jgi:RNA polymerase sigma-70 factor (ECF subfamily)
VAAGRAIRTLGDTGAPFEVLAGDQLAPRLASVLEVVYLIYSEVTPRPVAVA